MKLENVTSELLGEAVAVYLRIAYPEGGLSEAVRERAGLPAGARGAELLGEARFERVPSEAAVEDADRFNLRLGNARYPHMKLGIDRVSKTDEYVLVVDCHDKHFAALVRDGEQSRYCELLDFNRRVQHEVEQAWTEAGLPTFERYLRGRLASYQGSRRDRSGDES